MNIPAFLSFPKPYMQKQQDFIDTISSYLRRRGFEPRTLGVTDCDMHEPLTAIRRLMIESCGMLTIAFRRTYIQKGIVRPSGDIGCYSEDISNKWLTSPYSQIEPAMAFQIGLQILILRESGVIADGILERGVTGTYLPEFDLDNEKSYLDTEEWQQIIGRWEGFVRMVANNRGIPPKLY